MGWVAIGGSIPILDGMRVTGQECGLKYTGTDCRQYVAPCGGAAAKTDT